MVKTQQCRYCPKRIVFGIDQKGARIPLDVSAPTYRVLMVGAPDADQLVSVERAGVAGVEGIAEGNVYVSHFSTCPGASQASKKAVR